MRCGKDETKPQPTPVVTATATTTADLPVFAPPPPPEIEEDAGTDAGPEDAGKPRPTSSGAPAAAGAGVCSECGKGIPTSALTSAVSSTAGLARGCYQRALRTSGAEGAITVSVSVGANGSLCGARISSDSLHNPAISSCVLAKFQSRSYPKPEQGCVVVNVPISFKMKTP
jgi:outer membrane biosynthesis protein TonB